MGKGKASLTPEPFGLLDGIYCSLLPLVVPRIRAGMLEPEGKLREETEGVGRQASPVSVKTLNAARSQPGTESKKL